MNSAQSRSSAGAEGYSDAVPTRTRILDAAFDLFYREGMHAVGVDQIVAASGVGKMSLYRYFASKDELIREVLVEYNRRYWTWWNRVLEEHAGDPRGTVRALCETITSRFEHPTYRGCAFLNFTAEFAGPGHPGHAIVLANKQKQRNCLSALAVEMGAVRPEAFADHLMLLIEGARVCRLTLGAKGPAMNLTEAAEALLSAHLPS